MSPLTVFAAISLLATTVACAAPAGSAVGDSTANETAGTVQGDELVRCWSVSDGNTDAFFRTYSVQCHLTSATLAGLGRSFVAIDVHGADSAALSAVATNTPDADFEIGKVHTSAFPIELDVYGSWGTGEESSTPFRTKVSLTQSADAPASVRLPFKVWNVTVVNAGQLAIVSTQTRTLDASPFFTDQDANSTKTTFSTSASTGVIRSGSGSLVLLTKGEAVPVEVQTEAGSFNATIDGPGTWTVNGKTLARSSDDAGAPPPPASADGGTATTDDAGTPAPTCGAAGMQHCVAANGNWSCNAGTRVDANGTCLACGDDGQTYCVDDPSNVSGNWLCNAGTRLDDATSTCVACGGAGQTHCVADAHNISGNWTCSAGLTYDNDGICH